MGMRRRLTNLIESARRKSVTGRRYRTYGAVQELHERSVRESADFIRPQLDTALLFSEQDQLLEWAARRAVETEHPGEWLALEFGVAGARTTNLLADVLAPKRLTGFDSFEGLPEDWTGWEKEKGSFSTGGRLPAVRSNVELVKGWIDQTLPPFLEAHHGPIGFIHVDVDLYSPCRTILSLTRKRVATGTIIVFDELHSYPGWEQHEWRALQEVYSPGEYSFVAFSNMNQGAIRIR